MKTITAVILTKDEEPMIADCIDSVSFCDEIIVVDNNSTDRTVDIARLLKAQIIISDSPDFSHRRTLPLNKVKTDFIFYIDADERVSRKLKESIKSLLGQESSDVAFTVERNNFYLGKNEWPNKEKMLRLFQTEKLKGWKGNIHESPIFEGSVGSLEGYLIHFTHRSLSQMLQKTIKWSDIEAKNRFDSNHPIMKTWRFPKVMAFTFLRYFIKEKGYKLGTAGLIESLYQTYSIFITYAKLWELQQKEK